MENVTQWNLIFTGLEGFGLRAMVFIIAIAILFFSWSSIKNIRPVSRRILLFSLRLAGTLLIVLLLFQPHLEQKEVLKLKNKVVCLLDASKSMSLKCGDIAVTRAQLLDNFFTENDAFFKELQSSFDVNFFTFSDIPTETSYKDIRTGITPDGEDTDFAQTLKYLQQRYKDDNVKAFFLFSDGKDTVERPANVNASEVIAGIAREFSSPFFTFAPAENMEARDVALSSISYNTFTFARNPWKVDATIKVMGYNNLKLPVTLKEGSDIISTKVITANEEGEYNVTLSFTPYKTGTFLYTVSIPVQPKEAITENNQVSFLVKIVRDKIRVMHVCGRPSWDERFLRQALKNDPNIDLVSFFILRTPNDISNASNDELSLIPFPVDELFTEVLNSFDLVIFQNFDYRPYDSPIYRFSYYLSNIETFVKDHGGGFLMMGGDLSFTQGGYDGTSIEEILPVYLTSGKDLTETAGLRAALTENGQRHPVTTLDINNDRNLSIWENLPELDGCNITTQPKADAVVLATYPSQGEPPLIAVRDVGEGRCMAITADSLWRWNFLSVGRGGSNRYYMKFWQNTIKWLIKDPLFNPIHITINKDTFLPQEEVQVNIKVLEKSYQPWEGVHLEIDVTNEFTGKSIFINKGITGRDGQYTFNFKYEEEGFYIIKTIAKNESGEIGQEHTVFNIMKADKEFKDTSIERELLMKLAEVSGGKYFNLPQKDIRGKISIENPPITKLVGKKQISLWDKGYVFVIIISIVSFDWWIRKRSGLS
ncbi:MULTISPECIES: glutamine amidotransferase [Candidatus Kuenenia]|jgi:hypothetical protein|nr:MULTISPECIES: glutamine amidotransferase [Kuenenia]MBE7546428.1 hypothetical protein [Planctomycetia bacterium]MCL4725694.1 hypothetical protein [Candidatus Kuenenia stuttgartiensis]MCZ7623448.1 glutamine amidotransferase [Candidatus Kuenenia sp.]